MHAVGDKLTQNYLYKCCMAKAQARENVTRLACHLCTGVSFTYFSSIQLTTPLLSLYYAVKSA